MKYRQKQLKRGKIFINSDSKILTIKEKRWVRDGATHTWQLGGKENDNPVNFALALFFHLNAQLTEQCSCLHSE